MKPTILCVVPNAAVDRTLIVPDFEPGKIHRPKAVIVAAGGKGLNVARAVKILGGAPLAMGLLGGHSGRLVSDLVRDEGLDARWTWFEGETRTCVIIVPDAGETTLINESGGIVADDWRRLTDDIVESAPGAAVVCVSGSLPRGAPPDAPADLIRRLRELGKPVWLDTSGASLHNAIEAKPTGIKVNGAEAGEVTGREVESPESAAAAARALYERGISAVVITLGRRGAVLVDGSGSYYARPPLVDVVSAVASGDAFFAGLMTALLDGCDSAAALRRAIAAGTANAQFAGGSRFTVESFERTLAGTRLETLR